MNLNFKNKIMLKFLKMIKILSNKKKKKNKIKIIKAQMILIIILRFQNKKKISLAK